MYSAAENKFGKMVTAAQDEACILRIEKASIHDGEGLRNVVFFKGCPLRCAWCSTPESQRFDPEIGIDPSRCAGCGACAAACAPAALTVADGTACVDRGRCTGCFRCVAECPNRAIKKYGSAMSIHELAHEVSKDEIFYFHSGGGVTLSGGEPCAHADYAAKLLRELKARGIHTAVETSLYAPWERVRALLPYLDCVFADIKHLSPERHRLLTGADNAQILDNVRRIDRSDYPLVLTLRVPLIPGINDDEENLRVLAAFARSLTNKLAAIELLPYHRLGSTTYRLLGIPYALEATEMQPWEALSETAGYLASQKPGVPVLAGGREF